MIIIFPGQLLQKEFTCFQVDIEKIMWPCATKRKISALDMPDRVR